MSMILDFGLAWEELQASPQFETFNKDHTSYYLAHGFLQLDKEGNASKAWQIGFYSKEKDNLGVFSTSPVEFINFEDAFKEKGIISKLVFDKEVFIKTTDAVSTVKKILAADYSNEQARNYIIILQVIDDKPVYNITVITAAFSMITFQIHATSGSVLKQEKRSVLDLKKSD